MGPRARYLPHLFKGLTPSQKQMWHDSRVSFPRPLVTRKTASKVRPLLAAPLLVYCVTVGASDTTL